MKKIILIVIGLLLVVGVSCMLLFNNKNQENIVNKVEEKEETTSEQIERKKKELENKYNVFIVYNLKDLKKNEVWAEKYLDEIRDVLIIDAMDSIEVVLKKIGKDFLSIFKHDNYKGLRIIVVYGIESSNNSNILHTAGETFETDDYYNIVISNDGIPFEENLCHEMMHAIDDNAMYNKYDIAGNWYDYNPVDFEYNVEHYQNNDDSYTIYEDKDDAYFIDSYAKVNQYEDRARVFEHICYTNSEVIIKKYPSLLKKAMYIKDELEKYYPSIKESSIFDSVK
jgi:hypothetical protein